MRTHSTKIEAMKILVEYGLTRLTWDLLELDETILNWRIKPKANSVKWLLTHISMILNVYFPRAFTNNLNYLPENWLPNYHDNNELTLETILMHIEYFFLNERVYLNELTEKQFQNTKVVGKTLCLVHSNAFLGHVRPTVGKAHRNKEDEYI